MSGPGPQPCPDLSDRAALRAFALGLGVHADHLTSRAACWRERRRAAGEGRHGALNALNGFHAAHMTLADMAARLAGLPADALPPGAALDLDGDTPPALAGRVRDALAAMRDPDGLPVPAADLEAAAQTVLAVADALLSAAAPTGGVEPEPWCRVEVTATRLTFRPPCCPAAPIVLARDVTEPLALDRLECLACGLGYDVALLGDPGDGLWVSWRERPRRRADQP